MQIPHVPAWPFAAAASLVGLVVSGCAPAPTQPPAGEAAKHDHDHHHDDAHDHAHDHDRDGHAHADTLAGGVANLAKAATSLEGHLAADARDAADVAVHELGHLLEDLQELVRKSGLTDEAKATATKALDDLFECFGKLDTALHAEPGTGDSPKEVHGSIAKRVEEAVGSLRTAVTQGVGTASPQEDR